MKPCAMRISFFLLWFFTYKEDKKVKATIWILPKILEYNFPKWEFWISSLSITITEYNIKDSAIKNIANDFKKLYKNSPDDHSAYEYFSEYINLANHEAFVKINKKYEELIKDELEVVNVELDKYIKELELEYEIRGLETSFETKGINHNEIRDIDLKKSFLRDIRLLS